MRGKPEVTAQNRHEGIDVFRHHNGHLLQQEQTNAACGQRSEQISRRAVTKEESPSENYRSERDPDDRLEHISYRWPSRDDAPQRNATCVENYSECRDAKTSHTQVFECGRGDENQKHKEPECIETERPNERLQMVVKVFQVQLAI